MAELLKGGPVANALTEKLIEKCNTLKDNGIEPCLALVRAGEDPEDSVYENNAIKRCDKIGIKVIKYQLPENASEADMTNVITEINSNSSIHACLLFRPLKDKNAEAAAGRLLDSKKDVDCMTDTSLATVFRGFGSGYPPCTAEAVMEILDYYNIDITGKRVTVIGRSLIIGKPVSMLLQARHATITMCHTKTADLKSECRNSDIIVSATGHPSVVTADHVREGQIIIDVGIIATPDGVCGDVSFDEVQPKVAAITPVPGGVGSVTTAILCKHVIDAAESASLNQS